uniref:uncharacterized protein LOC125407151 isoform X3 n=1 Tax=Myodes glareolus TaxID=447135 RepID=UPI00201FC9A0|nr:uncharacterized protein LOC125407151 isoform X3 [Myodes glareolus]
MERGHTEQPSPSHKERSCLKQTDGQRSNRSQESLKVGTSSKSVTAEPSRKEQSHEGQAGRVGYAMSTRHKDSRHMPSSQMWALLPGSKAMAEKLTLQASLVSPPSLPGGEGHPPAWESRGISNTRLWQARRLKEAKDTNLGGFTTFHCLHPRQQAGLRSGTVVEHLFSTYVEGPGFRCLTLKTILVGIFRQLT